jgi:hypothetical protein
VDTSAISGSSAASTYVATSGGTSDASSDFASILASQTTGTDSSASTASGSAEQALNAYSAGQVTAYALQAQSASTDTVAEETAAASESSETSESQETSATSEGAGYPAEVNAEWTPGRMQFYDEATGKWMDDNIPHRISENGDLQYYADGEWHLDAAIKHRMVDENGNPIAMVDAEGNPIGASEEEAQVSAEGEAVSGEEAAASEDTAPQAEVYFNAALQSWKLYNLPDAVDKDGKRVYFWGESWHSDAWEHASASGSGLAVAGDPAGSAGVA